MIIYNYLERRKGKYSMFKKCGCKKEFQKYSNLISGSLDSVTCVKCGDKFYLGTNGKILSYKDEEKKEIKRLSMEKKIKQIELIKKLKAIYKGDKIKKVQKFLNELNLLCEKYDLFFTNGQDENMQDFFLQAKTDYTKIFPGFEFFVNKYKIKKSIIID